MILTMPPSTPGKRKLSTKRFASPGGLTTPTNWNNTYPMVNIDDLNIIQDVDMSMDASASNLPNTNTPAAYFESPYSTYNSATNNNNADNDVKPIDLSLYKEKLLKKMSMAANSSSPTNTQSLPLLPNNQVSGKKQGSLRVK